MRGEAYLLPWQPGLYSDNSETQQNAIQKKKVQGNHRGKGLLKMLQMSVKSMGLDKGK